MTRTTQEIQPDIDQARADLNAATGTRDAAIATAADLHRRARSGDVKVTAGSIAKAAAEASFVELPIPSLIAKVAAAEAELRTAQADIIATQIAEMLPPLAEAVDTAHEAARAALTAYVAAWADHSAAVRSAVDQLDPLEPLTERVRRVYSGMTLDNSPPIKPLPIFDPIEDLAVEAGKLAGRHGARRSATPGRAS